MGTATARTIHLALSLLGAVLYVLFVIPRWWVLTGDFPATLGNAGRIAAGVPIAAAAVPVMLALQRSLTAEPKPPELALRLRAWSAVLHVVGGLLIVAAAVAEIWLGLQAAGPWLFGVYGAAGAISALAVLAFVLSFTAEKPPAPPGPAEAPTEKAAPLRRRFRSRTTETGETSETEQTDEPEQTSETGETEQTDESGETGEQAPDDQSVGEPATQPGALLNRRPTGKKRHRLRR